MPAVLGATNPEGNPYKADEAGALAQELFSGKLSVAKSLERLRTRLIDLTMRNKLPNCRHPRGSELVSSAFG